ncbi:MAG: prepilin-type N-terminal cleavage/methylation domain-containing protein [Kiritimatiellaceae bacterium]|nr:prepilin-type N-terminal cleavage/methylation domain-containing protein [Kiritimatiellaceae bacterium]
MIPASPSRKNGLTLIEVMLAIVILGLGSGVMLLATARCIAIVTQTQRYNTAQRLIQQISAEHPLTRSDLEAGTESGRFDDDGDYSWEREIIKAEEENRKGLFTVRTRVSWSDRGKSSFEEITTWVYIKPEEEL